MKEEKIIKELHEIKFDERKIYKSLYELTYDKANKQKKLNAYIDSRVSNNASLGDILKAVCKYILFELNKTPEDCEDEICNYLLKICFFEIKNYFSNVSVDEFLKIYNETKNYKNYNSLKDKMIKKLSLSTSEKADEKRISGIKNIIDYNRYFFDINNNLELYTYGEKSSNGIAIDLLVADQYYNNPKFYNFDFKIENNEFEKFTNNLVSKQKDKIDVSYIIFACLINNYYNDVKVNLDEQVKLICLNPKVNDITNNLHKYFNFFIIENDEIKFLKDNIVDFSFMIDGKIIRMSEINFGNYAKEKE